MITINKDIKMLVSDYDNTFYLSTDGIEKNKEAVDKFRKDGNIFVIATGRSYLDIFNDINIYNLVYDYIIINHGATILDKEGNILYNFPIEGSIIENIKEKLCLDKVEKWFCCSEKESRTSFEHEDLTKINVLYSSHADVASVYEDVNKNYSGYVNSYYVTKKSIEIISSKTNKSKAISLLLNKLNILEKNVYTVGDGYNDIEMIRDFNGYAMLNSADELKKVCIKQVKCVSDLINEIM